MHNKRVALITGASSGIGESAAFLLQEKGFRVVGAARRVEKMKPLQEKGVVILPLDITREDSIVSCVDTILKQEGRIDALINNAGYGAYGAVEDVPIEEARHQFEVNLFGLARLTQLVLPGMRERGGGRIINISSMGGKIYTPFGAWYHATKHALESWSDCLRIELKPFGIDVVIVEPGGIKTPWGVIAADNLKKTSGNGPYAGQAVKIAESTARRYTSEQLSSPDVIAKTILRAVSARRPKTRYARGFMARPSIWIRKLLSDRMFDRLLAWMY